MSDDSLTNKQMDEAVEMAEADTRAALAQKNAIKRNEEFRTHHAVSVKRACGLSDNDHNEMDNYLVSVLDAYKAGRIDRATAVGDIAHVMTAIDKQNIGEVRARFAEFDEFNEPDSN